MEKKENGRQRIIFDGTAFYEIDLECVEQKERIRRNGKKRETHRQKGRIKRPKDRNDQHPHPHPP